LADQFPFAGDDAVTMDVGHDASLIAIGT
jgi:hypothetical protein